MVWFRRWFEIFSGKKPIKGFLFFPFLRSHGVQLFHLGNFIRGDLGKVPNKMHEFPAFRILFRLSISPGWHSRKGYAVMNDVKDFSVCHGLDDRFPKVRNRRVKIWSHVSFSASIIPMALFAMVGKMVKRLIGFLPEKISNHFLNHTINTLEGVDT